MSEELRTEWFKDNPDYWFNCRGCGGLLKFRLIGWMRVKFIKNNVKGGFEVYCRDCGEHNGWIPEHPNRKPPKDIDQAEPLF